MEFLKLVSVFLLFQQDCYLYIESAKIRCKIGLERYTNATCIKCKCARGKGIRASQMLPDYSTRCPQCLPCLVGTFSGPETDHLCVSCSPSCEIQKRITLKQCDVENDATCGQCLQGYSPDEQNVCLNADERGRRIRQQLREEDHTIYFVLIGVAIPTWIGFICCFYSKNKKDSLGQGWIKNCKSPSEMCTPTRVFYFFIKVIVITSIVVLSAHRCDFTFEFIIESSVILKEEDPFLSFLSWGEGLMWGDNYCWVSLELCSATFIEVIAYHYLSHV